MRILVVCGAAMSSSLLVKRMNDYGKNNAIDIEAKATSLAELPDIVHLFDVLLVSPQIRFQMQEIFDKTSKTNIPIDNIPPLVYGGMNAKEAIAIAQRAYDKSREEKSQS